MGIDKRYAIFDLDGTLVDSMGYWEHLAGEFLASKGVEEVSGEILEKIAPMTMSQSAQLFIQAFGLSGTPEELAAEMNAMMDRHYQMDIPLKEGVKAYLAHLYREGVRMCVASATAEPLMEACLRRLDVRPYFSFLLSCETVGAGKTEPDIYLAAARRLGSLPQETAVYEDALYAAATAKKAGFYVVGVYDAYQQRHWDKIKRIADRWVRQMKEEIR